MTQVHIGMRNQQLNLEAAHYLPVPSSLAWLCVALVSIVVDSGRIRAIYNCTTGLGSRTAEDVVSSQLCATDKAAGVPERAR